MTLRTTKCAVDEEDDWEIISPTDWWHTSVDAARWSFAPRQHAVESLAPRPQFHGSLFYEKISVDSRSRSSSKEHRNTDDDDTLNVELDGVKGSMDALSVYERHVGFHLDIQIIRLVSHGVIDLKVAVDEKDLLLQKKVWDELLEDLMNGPAFDNQADSDECLESSFIGEDLLRSTSTISSIGTSFSEGSIDSIGMPSTPKPKSSFGDVEIKDLSPAGSVNGGLDYNLSPRRSLNATASSFIPTFTPQMKDEPLQFPSLDSSSPLASFANFTFPTLNAPSETKRDDQVCHPTTQSVGLLPPFLQEPSSQRNRYRKSRTREIVDRLRSQGSPVDVVSPKFASHSPSPINDHSNVVTPRLSVSEDGSRLSTPSFEEEDAWIDLTAPTVTSSSSPTQKARRTRELFLALTRRRTDSLSSENVKDMMTASESSALSSQSSSQNISSESSPLQHSPPSLVASTEGWIEAFAPLEPQKQPKQTSNSSRDSSQHSRKKSTNHMSRASTSSSNSYSQHSHHLHSHGVSSSSSLSQHHPHQHHQHPHHHYRHHPHASTSSTFSATSPYLPHQQHTHHHSMLSAPASSTMPYFFSAYPAVAMPVPFTAFMHMPAANAAYRIPGSVQPMHVAPHHPMYGAPGGPGQQPTPMRGSMPQASAKQSLNSTTPSSTTNMTMNMTPDIYKGKHSPLW
ncbi:hypothetical protein M413DRAFT_179108 [Hebeloma cylindrosporum]|uniref:Uncharacterized protein n=1 Tax=Hebeloma cylindrosporum TaxID=76867 RepID=A0A0C2XRS3_HEBCY|nr:hypothetical protein M413DRAFT_179108 [Hebeloma cylindrosporum h7]